MGLASILIACKTQRVKHAILWLTHRKDIYFSAWQAYVFEGASDTSNSGVSPLDERTSMRSISRHTTGYNLQQLLQPWLAPSLPDSASRRQRYMDELESLKSTAISWTTPEEWVVEMSRSLPRYSREMTTEEQAFWPTYSWADNPWILDRRGNPLTTRQCDKIQPGAI